MIDVLLKKLTDFGLSEKEAQIYIALLELEIATVFQVAKHSGVNRSSAYVVLESLKKKGLAGVSNDRKVRRYVAALPDTLLDMARYEMKKTENTCSNLESIIPNLKALYKGTKRKPIVKIFEGQEGIREVFFDLLNDKSATDLKTFSDANKMLDFFPELLEYTQKRSKKGIKMFAVNPATKETLNFVSRFPPPRGDVIALIPREKFTFPAYLGIYGNKIALISTEGKMGIIIESSEITSTIRSCFDLSWEEAKRLDKVIRKK